MKRSALAVVACGVAAVATPAWAQEAPVPPSGASPDAAGETALGDIVVTAQRRSERLQDVPISITAADAQALAAARVDNIANIQAISPSVAFRVTNIASASANVIIRGLGTSGNSRTFEGSVGIFIDGVYRTRAATALSTFLDIDNLQILRGPQGTLFGKNTTAGAILLSSTAPTLDRFTGSMEGSYGNYGTFLVKGAVNVPLGSNAAFRVAAVHSSFDGYYNDVLRGGHLNGNATDAIKGQFSLEPADGLSIRLIGDYARGSGNCCYATVNYIDGPTQPLINGLTLAAGRRLPSANFRDYETSIDRLSPQRLKDYGGTLLLDLELGAGTLKSVTALRQFTLDQANTDPDFSGADIFTLDETFDSRFFSQELSYNGTIGDSAGTYVLGAFYSNERLRMTRDLIWASQGQAFWNAALGAAGLPPGTAFAGPGMWAAEQMGGRNRSYAAFAHFDVKVADTLNVIAGLRYSVEKKSGYFFNSFYRSQPNDVFRLLGVQPGPAYDAVTDDKAISGTLGVQYRPSRDAMFYATYNRGFKAGGVNIDANAGGLRANNPVETPGGVPLDPRYRPEVVNAFEAGAKLQYLDRRARSNIAFFYYDLSDVQVAQFIGLQFTVLNARAATDYGVEIENLFQITPTLTLGIDGTWIPKADYASDPAISTSLSGQRFRFAPKVQANVSLNLDQPVSDALNLTGRIQYQYMGRQFVNTASTTQRPPVNLVNANLGVKLANGRVTIEGFVLNLFDQIYPTQTFNTPLQTGDQNAYLAPPRTFGIRTALRF